MRFSDIGWTDVTATTGIASHLVRLLGYEPEVTVLSVPVTYASLKNRDIDVFLGTGCRHGGGPQALPGRGLGRGRRCEPERRQVHARGAGLPARGRPPDFTDIQRFATELGHEIYGIEPGNDGNRLVLTLIQDDAFGLGDFKLVESSEQGMLAQVERAIAGKRPIVFFGWEPHPMNSRFDMRYLTGGDSSSARTTAARPSTPTFARATSRNARTLGDWSAT